MDKNTFDRIFARIEYFYDIHMNSHHVKIANLAYEECAALFLEIISLKGEELLKNKIQSIKDKDLVKRILIFLTAIDLEWAKSTYMTLIDNKPVTGSDIRPTIWNNFIDSKYLKSTREFLFKINRQRKLELDEILTD